MKLFLSKLWRKLHLPKNVQLSVMRVMQDEFLVGVTGVIINDKNEILVCKHTYRTREWSLPGGYLKAREHPREGLQREIEEETGFIVRVDKQLKTRTDRDTARLDIAYQGKFVGGEFHASEEVTEAQFFPFESLPLLHPHQLILINDVLHPNSSSHHSMRSFNRMFRKSN